MEADEKKCPMCAETVKAEAKVCRFCDHSFEIENFSDPATPPPTDKAKRQRNGCLGAIGIVIVLVIIGSILKPDAQRTLPVNAVDRAGTNRAAASEPATNPTISDTKSNADQSEEVPNIGLFGPRANATRSAKQYLDISGFSRQGLIDQLSSDAGNGYSVEDATAAVDSLNVDWNEQAVRSAKQYLGISGFSCSGLIDQLSSDSGSKYTKAQARYGAEQAGAC